MYIYIKDISTNFQQTIHGGFESKINYGCVTLITASCLNYFKIISFETDKTNKVPLNHSNSFI